MQPNKRPTGLCCRFAEFHVAGLQFTKEDHEHDFCFHESTPQNTLITSYYPYPFDLYCWRKLQGCPHVTIFSWFCWGLWMPGQMTSAGCRASENGLKERTNLASGLCSQSALGHRASWIVRRDMGAASWIVHNGKSHESGWFDTHFWKPQMKPPYFLIFEHFGSTGWRAVLEQFFNWGLALNFFQSCRKPSNHKPFQWLARNGQHTVVWTILNWRFIHGFTMVSIG